MKKIVLLILITVSLFSCKKDKDCLIDLKKENSFVFFNRMSCSLENYSFVFKSKVSFDNQTVCGFIQPTPFPINFNGIIVAQGVKVPYVGPQGGDPGYELDVKIMADTCERMVDFKFILTTIDTSRIFEHNENVLVLLDGIDSTFTVNFSHEIIPYKE
jgi:hypothetical protein